MKIKLRDQIYLLSFHFSSPRHCRRGIFYFARIQTNTHQGGRTFHIEYSIWEEFHWLNWQSIWLRDYCWFSLNLWSRGIQVPVQPTRILPTRQEHTPLGLAGSTRLHWSYFSKIGFGLNKKKNTCDLELLFICENLLIFLNNLVPPIFTFPFDFPVVLWFLFPVNQLNDLCMSDTFGRFELNNRQSLETHVGNNKRMFAIETTIIIWYNWICHRTSRTCRQNCILVTERFGSDCQTTQLHFLGPFVVDN